MATGARVTDKEGREANDDALAPAEEVFLSGPDQHWKDTLLAADIGCMVAHREPPESVLQPAEFAGAADLPVEVEHPTTLVRGHVRLRFYVSFSRRATVAEPGMLAASRTDAILSGLGYAVEAIADLRERKVVA